MNEAERQQFEKWANSTAHDLPLQKVYEGGPYQSAKTSVAFEAWQAARASESSPPQPEQCFAEYSISGGTAFCLHDKGHDGPHWARNIDIDICWPMNCVAAATAPSAPPDADDICLGHCDRCNAVCLSKAAPTINRAINAALKNASGGESPLSEQTQDFNKVCGLPLIFVVEGSHSRTAFFNRTEAERYLAERKQPERFAIVEYVKSAGQQIDLRRESDSRWLAEVPSIPGCMAYGRTQSEAVIKVGKLLEQIEAESKRSHVPTKEEAEKAVDEMFRQRLSRHHVFYANKTLRSDTWREIAISLYMRPSTPVAAQGQQKNPFPPACMHGVALTVFCRDCSVGNALKGEAAQGGTQETTKEKKSCNRHVDCEIAVQVWLEKHPGKTRTDIPFSFHCHDEECEDCFGQ